MKNKMVDLRNHLFATLEGLLDDEKPLELERAKTVAEVAQVLVNSAKAEVDYLRAANALGVELKPAVDGFIPLQLDKP